MKKFENLESKEEFKIKMKEFTNNIYGFDVEKKYNEYLQSLNNTDNNDYFSNSLNLFEK